MKLHQWSAIPREQLNPTFARQVIHSGGMTVARVFLAKGAIVPEHSHPNEQVCYLETGKLVFRSQGQDHVLSAGEVLEIPPGVPHSVEALEDSAGLDLFTPKRQDWIDGNDAYLRK